MKRFSAVCVLLALGAMLAGCKGYSWRPSVPEGMRTVAVPTFRNESGLTEIGAISTRQILREFQREGTFKIRRTGEAALEVQGTVRKVSQGGVVYNRRNGARLTAGELTMEAFVSLVDKREGKVIFADRPFRATTSLVSGKDLTTAERDASGRLADDLSRQVVDAVLGSVGKRDK